MKHTGGLEFYVTMILDIIFLKIDCKLTYDKVKNSFRETTSRTYYFIKSIGNFSHLH